MRLLLKYKILSVLLLLMLEYCSVQAQQSNEWLYATLAKAVKDTSSVFKIDHLGQIYTLKNNQLNKINSVKNLFFRDDFSGEISYFDVYNPLRILVYCQESDKLIFLDNQLSIVSELELTDLDLFDIAKVCSSYDNGFWIFNKQNSNIEYYNEALKKSYSSENLSYKIKNTEHIKGLFFNNKHLFLQVEGVGILMFDVFAHYIKTIPICAAKNVLVTNNGLFFTQNQQIYFYNFKRLQSYLIYIAKNPISELNYYSQKLIFKEGDVLQQVLPHAK